jgi:hypothetical protein
VAVEGDETRGAVVVLSNGVTVGVVGRGSGTTHELGASRTAAISKVRIMAAVLFFI